MCACDCAGQKVLWMKMPDQQIGKILSTNDKEQVVIEPVKMNTIFRKRLQSLQFLSYEM